MLFSKTKILGCKFIAMKKNIYIRNYSCIWAELAQRAAYFGIWLQNDTNLIKCNLTSWNSFMHEKKAEIMQHYNHYSTNYSFFPETVCRHSLTKHTNNKEHPTSNVYRGLLSAGSRGSQIQCSQTAPSSPHLQLNNNERHHPRTDNWSNSE